MPTTGTTTMRTNSPCMNTNGTQSSRPVHKDVLCLADLSQNNIFCILKQAYISALGFRIFFGYAITPRPKSHGTVGLVRFLTTEAHGRPQLQLLQVLSNIVSHFISYTVLFFNNNKSTTK